MHSLVDGFSRLITATTAGKSPTEVQANSSTKTCQNEDPQNPCNVTDEGEIFNMSEMQNPYKLPLNPEFTLFTEKPHESANNVIGYHYRFEHNM